MTINGSCLCGTVKYEITGAQPMAGNCHCPMCRKANGAPFVSWLLLEPGQFRWTAGADAVESYPSSPGRARCFCRKCGSQLAAWHEGQITEVVMGTVDGDPGVRPGSHIFVAHKAPWHDITDALPQYPEWPPGFGP